jgi:hypothetical protein
MRFFIGLLCLAVSCAGCYDVPDEESSPVAVTIDGMTVTVDEFNNAYAQAQLAGGHVPACRREFLDQLVQRRLLLREAGDNGLDRDPRFLQSVELFWQQSLLKLMLDRKMREISVTTEVDEQEIREYFEQHKEEYPDKTVDQMRDRIRFLLSRLKQQQVLEAWLQELRNRARVEVREDLLQLDEAVEHAGGESALGREFVIRLDTEQIAEEFKRQLQVLHEQMAAEQADGQQPEPEVEQ